MGILQVSPLLPVYDCCTIGEACRQASIYQDDFVASVYQIVLKTATIADVLVKLLGSLFAAKYEWLRIESVFSEFYCFDFHIMTELTHGL